MSDERLHLVTGKLAAQALEEVMADLAQELGLNYTIQVLPITVAGLMTPNWVARHISVPQYTTRVLLPGYCTGDQAELHRMSDCEFVVGPKDLRELPRFLGSKQTAAVSDYGAYDIEIIAEINHAPRLSLDDIAQQALALLSDGADIIDVGCIPGERWLGVADCVRALVDLGARVSIDSMDIAEIGDAVKAGAELVLSATKVNRHAAADWGCEVVAIPDDTQDLSTLFETVDYLERADVNFRIDPIVEPIGFGFAQSIRRYMDCRQRYPEASMMMGIGNLTELSDCDSAGLNFLLLAVCQELKICSVLTTQVINWARSSIRECDIARRLVHYAVNKRQLPKHLDDRLVMLRDAAIFEQGPDALEALAAQIRDQNIRVYAEHGNIHLLTGGHLLSDPDPFVLFQKLQQLTEANKLRPLSASHAFYLGHELCKADIALRLGKQYRQDESLRWGFIGRQERDGRTTADD